MAYAYALTESLLIGTLIDITVSMVRTASAVGFTRFLLSCCAMPSVHRNGRESIRISITVLILIRNAL